MKISIHNKPEIFLLWCDEILERIDPLFYANDIFGFLSNISAEVVTLEEVTTYMKTGFAAGKQDQSKNDGGIIQIRPTNMDDFGILKFDKNIVLPESVGLYRPKDLLQKGEVLFNNTNSQELVGKTSYFDLDGEYFCSNHITRIRVDEKKLLPKFLWLLLNNYQKKGIFFNICVNWNNQSGVNVELLKTLKIPLPSIERQKTIINTLEKAYAEKRKKVEEIKKNFGSIDDFVLGELGIQFDKTQKDEKVFTVWSDEIEGRIDPMYFHPARIEAIEAIKRSGISCLSLHEVVKFRRELVDNIPENMPYLGLENIVSNSGEYIETEIKESISSAFVFKRGDVLFPKLRPYLNKVFYADFDGVCSTEFHVLQSQKYDPYYLFSFLTRSVVVNQTSRLMTGNTLPRLQTEDIENLLIPIPKMNVQEKIVFGVKTIYSKAKQLEKEAKTAIVEAQKQVEDMILN